MGAHASARPFKPNSLYSRSDRDHTEMTPELKGTLLSFTYMVQPLARFVYSLWNYLLGSSNIHDGEIVSV